MKHWRNVSRRQPCTICGKPDWCGYAEDGSRMCHRVQLPGAKIHEGAGGTVYIYSADGTTVPPVEYVAPNAQLANEDTRHRVYAALLAKLSLSTAHRDHLRGRGFSDQEIQRREYRTLPVQGRSALAKELAQSFGPDVCTGVPGWTTREGDHGRYATIAGSSGILIPVRNVDGQIVALKVRADEASLAGRYSYLSSAKDGGPKADNRAHVPIDRPADTSLVRVTEGELKADIATLYSNTLTLSAPGLGAWETILAPLAALRVRAVLVAFDMDYRENHHVRQAFCRALRGLISAGYQVRIEEWDARFKGIDDLFNASYRPHVLAHESARQFLSQLQGAA